MFSKLDIDKYIDDIQKYSQLKKKKIHKEYLDIYKHIFKYCVSNNIILSNSNLLIDKNYIENMLEYDCYTNNPLKHANNLSNELLKYTKNIEMLTKIPFREFSIIINSQILPVVNLYALPKCTTDFIRTIPISIYEIKIKLMPPEVELINIYRKLYLPDYASKWKTIVDLEYTIFSKYNIHDITKNCNVKLHISNYLTKIKSSIVNKWCKNTDNIIVGYWACYLLNIKISDNMNLLQAERLQLISKNSIENECLSLEKFLEKEFNTKIAYKVQDIDVPKDFRLKKYIFTMNGHIFLEIFNSASFELIPTMQYKETNAIGNIFVLLRFLFIDYWILSYVISIKKIPVDIGKRKLCLINNLIINLRKSKYITTGFNKQYVGHYENEQMADKIRRIKGTYYSPYLPHIKKRIL